MNSFVKFVLNDGKIEAVKSSQKMYLSLCVRTREFSIISTVKLYQKPMPDISSIFSKKYKLNRKNY